METYINDMMIKTVEPTNHVKDLEEVFRVIREYRMRLNPKKCIFGV